MIAKLPVSVVIPVRNEAANLPACLARLSRFDEVIVVDSGSSDGTDEIATRAGFTLLQFVWDGHFPKKRNWVLLNAKLSNEWVLFLDADELVSEQFCDELEHTLASTKCNGFWLRYTNHFMGEVLHFGVLQSKLALFRVGAGLYEQIEEANWSSLDMEVHEHPIIEGSTGEIAAPIDHRDDRGLARFIDRHKDYALWESQRTVALRKDGTNAWHKLTDRQKTKYRNLDKWWFAPGYFFWTYVAKRGFLDGATGLSYAFYKFWYFWTIRLLIKEHGDKSKP